MDDVLATIAKLRRVVERRYPAREVEHVVLSRDAFGALLDAVEKAAPFARCQMVPPGFGRCDQCPACALFAALAALQEAAHE